MRAQWRRDIDQAEFLRLAGHTNIHRGIAADVYPKGATLTCGCGHSQPATSEQCGEYLHSGWPKHCGLIMGATAL
jgi:hypothetical protein